MMQKNNGILLKERFAARLKQLRREKGLTQSELAANLDVSRACIANWENGERLPEVSAITTIAKFFKVSIDYICGKSDERYNIKMVNNIDFDLRKLNGLGIDMLCEYYNYLISNEKYSIK